MKTKAILVSLLVTTSIIVFGQRPTLEMNFTAENDGLHVQLDSIKIMNRTQGGETMLYWPDTSVSLDIIPGDTLLFVGYSTSNSVGFQEIKQEKHQFQLFQNYPNPAKDQSIVSLNIPEKGTLNLLVTDIQGRVVLTTDRRLEKGNHSFRFSPGAGNLFFITASWNGISRSIKVLATGSNSGKRCMLEYTSSGTDKHLLKASLSEKELVMESGILGAPAANKTYTFQFATNIPCPGMPTVEFEGQVYNTIQIFSQCWLKENLNVGTMIDGLQQMTDNGILEKYCYQNEDDSCSKYGGLYQWKEMMQYTTQPGAQGICPPGCHLPTDEEWKVLEGAVDSQYGIGDPEWDIKENWRGYDDGTNLKTTNGWYANGNGTDLYGFSGLPGGWRLGYDLFYDVGSHGYWWMSTEYDGYNGWDRNLSCFSPGVLRYNSYEGNGFSVRCLRDN